MKNLNDQLLGALVGLSRASESKEISASAGDAFVDGLALSHTLASSFSADSSVLSGESCADADRVLAMIDRLHKEKDRMAPDCAACQYPCGRTFDYEMEEVYSASETLRNAKLNLLHLLGEIAVSDVANQPKEHRQFLSDALFQISCTYTADQLADPLKKAREILQNS